MVILKIDTGTDQEREVEIVNEEGTWKSGSYHIFASAFLENKSSNSHEPHNINSKAFLGKMSIDKEKATWKYNGDKLDKDEQEQIGAFILDYSPPDGVY